MFVIRTVIAALLAALLGLGALAAPVQADRALPKRTLSEQAPGENQIDFRTFRLKGTITELQVDGVTYLPYAERAVQLQKKVCVRASCPWKTIKKIKTNELGKYRTNIYGPSTGAVKWRIKVKASDGYGTTKGTGWELGSRPTGGGARGGVR